MKRRRVLQMGAALATLPLLNCSAGNPEPTATPEAKGTSGKPPTTAESPVPSATVGQETTTAAQASADPSATPSAGEPQGSPKSNYGRVVARVGKNHGHVFTVAFDDVRAGAARSYDIAGTSGHPHTVALSAEDMKTLATGAIVRMKSSRDKQHAHRVLVRCAPPVDPPEWITVCDATFSGQDEHELVIPAADMAAKTDKTYDVQGIAGHPHQVTVTAADFEKLAKGEAVSPKTTRDPDDAHLHVVFIQYKKPQKA